jgi:hypothetical protein
MLCYLVKAYQSFRGTRCLYFQCQRSIKEETACFAFSLNQKVMAIYSIEASVDFHQVTWCHIPEDSESCENFKSNKIMFGNVSCHSISRRLYNTKNCTMLTLFWHDVNQWLTRFLTRHCPFGFSPNPYAPSSNVLLTEINAKPCAPVIYSKVTCN